MLSTTIEWVSLLVRWTHVIAGICWIGSSFYFMALDAGLKHHPRLDVGVKGESWQVHGGGFYQMQKFTVAPDFMPDELVWYKWEAYSTFIFGFILLVLTYYLNPTRYLIDPNVMDLKPWDAVGIGAASLLFGWLAYDALCRSPLANKPAWLATVGFALLIAVFYFYSQVFSGRGAFIHAGALVGTIMVANVALVIIPNQHKTVADLLAGREPNPAYGITGKNRSTHNNYVTLPVIFAMISNHYAFLYSSKWNWLVLGAVFVGGFMIRHWFNIKHTGETPDWRWWPAGAVPIALAAALTIYLQPAAPSSGGPQVAFGDVQHIIGERCVVCHSAHPSFPGIAEAPKGIRFDTPKLIAAQAPLIYAQAVVGRAMPLGNVTGITEEERQALASWYGQGASTN